MLFDSSTQVKKLRKTADCESLGSSKENILKEIILVKLQVSSLLLCYKDTSTD